MHSSVIPVDSNSFFRDGRKICVGDCALFILSNKSSPCVGLIRWLALNKENNLQLGVNWLYRSSELTLGKAIQEDSAPNEIFYSFQKNEIPAESLLHLCKVLFLPGSVELPTWISSFVCRRAYDISNKSLGWLTDKHYVNDQQEEVDQLLHKTKTEMHVTMQSGGRSPKQSNCPTSTSQLKASDSGQNSGSSFHSQGKGKKRGRSDHGADSVKRERSSRLDGGDSVQSKTESNLKNEIARITENGVVDSEGVEELVQLMQPDKEKKMDLATRSMLASIMASIDKVDCLTRFVQLRGLPVLDEWLQDIHKGKIGDGDNRKDGDKRVEEFLLVLLRALDKLPVNLQALQMCNIGRSVNHLRSHKNTDIQRRARSLVDGWKKRVEAELISIDSKSGSTQAVSAWPSRSRLPDASHGGNGTPNGPDVAIKNSSPGPIKPASSLASEKGSQPRTSPRCIPDDPQTKEDVISSFNQSHNCSQSFSTKGDLKSTTSGSVTVNKISSIVTRNRKISGFPGTSATGSQKETSSSKGSPAHKSIALEKLPHSAIAGGRVVEEPNSEGNTHKLIVKIPNRARSPAQCVSGGSLEDHTTMDKHEQSDLASKDKSATSWSNVESDMNEWKNNDPNGRSEGVETHAVLHDKEQSMTIEDSKIVIEGPPKIQLRSVNLHTSSFSPMNALIESCVKYSEATPSLSLEDDVGMNLLASVATGEMSRSDVTSPTDSAERSNRQVEEVSTVGETKSGLSPKDCPPVVQNRLHNDGECDDKKQTVLDSCSTDGKFDKSHSLEGIPSDSVSKCGIGGTDHLSIDKCKSMIEVEEAKPLGEGLDVTSISQHKPTATVSDNESLDQAKFCEKSLSPGNAQEPNGCDTNAAGESNNTAVPCTTSIGLNDECKEASPDEQDIPGHISPQERQCTSSEVHETVKDELTGSMSNNIQLEVASAVFSSIAGSTDPSSRMKFDLNEGLGADDGKCGELVTSTPSGSSSVHKINALPFSVNPILGSHSASNNQYVTPEDILRNKVELGWKGSAATSAFRPAEPRKVVEIKLGPLSSSCPDASTSKSGRFPLDIDLNVADDRVLEEMASLGSGLAIESTTDLASDSIPLRGSGGLDLDLNLVDEADAGNFNFSTSSTYHGEAPLLHVKPGNSFHIQRDFDLNNGPTVDDTNTAGHFSINHLGKGVASSHHSPGPNLTMNNPGLSSFSSWFPPGNTFSTMSTLPNRAEQPFPVIPPAAFQRAFNPDVYRGSVLSSSPSVPFQPSPFQVPVFPFGTTFPHPSSSFSVGGTSYPDSSSSARPFALPVNSQYLAPVGSIAHQFQRPYVVGFPDISNSSGWASNRKWGGPGLDLNAGPITVESESEEMFSLSSGQNSSGVLKRKEPEAGSTSEPFRHKQHSSWQ